MNWHPMQLTVWWVLLKPNGEWWCEMPFHDPDLAQRTADKWNSTPPVGAGQVVASYQLRVAKIQIQEQP